MLVDLAAVARAGCLDDELGRVNVRQFGSVSVPSSGDLGLVVVVVGRCEELAEDEFGDPDPLGRVHLDRDSLAVVVDRNRLVVDVDRDLEVLHVGVADLVVGGVDENLVDNLV